MDEFKTILLNDDFSIAYYSKKKNKDYASLNKANQIVVCRIVNNMIREEYY